MKWFLASLEIAKIIPALFPKKKKLPELEYDLTRFDEQDIILESAKQIQELLPDILGQALARTWVDKRFRCILRSPQGNFGACGCVSSQGNFSRIHQERERKT